MLRLVYSNRTEGLLAELAARVAAQQSTGGALAPVRIVAQNTTVAQYLRLGVARETGVAANLQITLITRFAAETIAQSTGARVADADALAEIGGLDPIHHLHRRHQALYLLVVECKSAARRVVDLGAVPAKKVAVKIPAATVSLMEAAEQQWADFSR